MYCKEGIVEFAKALIELGWQLIASGGTAKALAMAGIPVKDVAGMVGGGAILGHRVVTLSREVHAGLLANNVPEDIEELERLGVPFIDLVCIDLYPLEEEIAREGCTRESVIEKTDIGGPTMLRSAAKGRRIVICDPDDRWDVIEWLKAGKPDEENYITRLAAKTEGVVAGYALASARYHSGGIIDGFVGTQVATCMYGENPYMTPAGLFVTDSEDPLALQRFHLVEGTDPSYINWTDVDRLIQGMTHVAAGFDVNFGKVPLIAIAVKHGNACGAAVGNDPIDVLRNMVEGDPLAIFGGVVMMNFPLTEDGADVLLHHKVEGGKRILDTVIAPSISEGVLPLLERKGGKCRMLENSELADLTKESLDHHPRFRLVRGGFLRQPNYTFVLDLKDPNIVVYGDLTDQSRRDIIFAWALGATSNSNTIMIVINGRLLGRGVGQQSRVDACKLAGDLAIRSFNRMEGAVVYSDSFFPFPDGPEVLISLGVKTIFTSSGSVKDKETIELCKERGVTLVMFPDKKGRGFFCH